MPINGLAKRPSRSTGNTPPDKRAKGAPREAPAAKSLGWSSQGAAQPRGRAAEGTARAPAPGPKRDAASGLTFVSAYDQKLGLSPQDAAGKHELMRRAPLNFFRATPSLFVNDLKGSFASAARLSDTPAPRVTVLVDPHLGNFGSLRGPDGKAVWGLNDYDQVARGSPEVDLERLASSVVLEARARGLSPTDQQALVQRLYDQYSSTVHAVTTGKEPGQAWLSGKDVHGAGAKLVNQADATARKDFLAGYVKDPEKDLRFKNNGELRRLSGSEEGAVQSALVGYGGRLPEGCRAKVPLEVLDTAAKLGGGSSYGLPRYVVLVKNAEKGKAPILLEIKSAPPSPLVSPSGDPGQFDGKAVAEGQRSLGGQLNPLFGYTRVGAQSMMVRELEPERGSVALDKLSGNELDALVGDAARVLARAHAAQPAAAKQLDAWLHAAAPTAPSRLESFAVAYADQTEKDFAAFKATGN